MPLSETILIIMGLLTVAMIAAGICRNLPIPFTALLVIFGIGLGSAARTWQPLAELQAFQLTPDLVLFLFLPALIFESAFNLNARQLLKDLGPILSMAIPALLISTAIIGIGLWWLIGMDIFLALLFGALISATDPVAVVALFKELGAPQRLTVLIEGESLLNDATAIVVFNIVLGLLLSGSFVFSDLGDAFAVFLRVFFGGALIGAVAGILLSELLHRLEVGLSSYLVMSVVLAFACFAVAEHLMHVSGVMAVLAAAMSLSAFGVSRMPQSGLQTIKETWEVLALVCNSLLFLLVGLSVDLSRLLASGDTIMLAILLVLLARATTVYSMVPATARIFGLPRIHTGERHIMWWGGLKGGLAIAIVLSIPEQVAGRDLLLDITLGVVLFSLLVSAPTIRPMMRWLKVDRMTDDERDELRDGFRDAEKQAEQTLQRFYDARLVARSTQQLIQREIRQVFSGGQIPTDPKRKLRHLHAIALRTEVDELKRLYDIGLIQQYIYMDLRNALYRDRQFMLGHLSPQAEASERARPDGFRQLESALIKRLREHDWAAAVLARYQHLRFSQSLQRDMAGVMTATAVLETLRQQDEYPREEVDQVAGVYESRLAHLLKRLQAVARDFPDFYLRFETHLFSTVSMLAARDRIESANQHGEIALKTFASIERRIRETISELPAVSLPARKLTPSDLIGTVPLLQGLSEPALSQLASRAIVVTFIDGDIIIGEGERGDALYIIIHGRVKVYRESDPERMIADLGNGDFFGEIALLGDHVRTATVEATTPSTLLRLSRDDLLALAEVDAELKTRLKQANESRQRSDV